MKYYIKSYLSEPEPLRRQLIEQLYRKINGSLDGLDQRLSGSAAAAAVGSPTPEVTGAGNAPATSTDVAASVPSPEPVASSEQPANAVSTPSPDALATPSPEAVSTPPPAKPVAERESSDNSKQPPAETTPAPAATPTEEQSLAQAAARLRTTIKITGRVKDADNKGIPNVVVVLISPRGTVLVATTDADGKYSFSISPSQRNYRLVPSKDDLKRIQDTLSTL